MCFYRDGSKSAKKLRFAWEPVPCRKFLNTDINGTPRSAVKGFSYRVGRTYWRQLLFLNLLMCRIFNCDEVEHGFHSYTIESQERKFNYDANYECVIPRFSVYFENDGLFEYVSSGMKIIKRIDD